MNTITLHRTPAGWVAKFSDAIASGMFDRFGTDTLPTAFAAAAEPEVVAIAISRLNPDYAVTIAQ